MAERYFVLLENVPNRLRSELVLIGQV